MLKRSPSPLGNCYSLELSRGVLAPLSWKNASPLVQGQARWVARGGLVPYQKEQGGEAYKLFLLTTASCSDAGKLKIKSCKKLALFPLLFDAFRHPHVWLDNKILVHGGQHVEEVRHSIVEGFGVPSSFSPSLPGYDIAWHTTKGTFSSGAGPYAPARKTASPMWSHTTWKTRRPRLSRSTTDLSLVHILKAHLETTNRWRSQIDPIDKCCCCCCCCCCFCSSC